MSFCLATARSVLLLLLRAVLVALSLTSCIRAQNLSNDQLQLVVARLADGAKHSWEFGTRAQALLELNAPFYSVFSNTTLPPPSSPPSSSSIPANLTDVISIAQAAVSKLNDTDVPQPLVSDDGAAGDPPSIGVAVILANLTNAPLPAPNITNTTSAENKSNRTSSTTLTSTTTTTTALTATATDVPDAKNVTGTATNSTNATVPSFANAATRQLEFLLTAVPQTSDGAISHRLSEVQLWSDNVYMVPPFLAYYGVIAQNKTLVAESYNQIKLYRKYLRDTNAHNLWKHIQLGSAGNDDGHWSTGNGWATAGMLRVLATIKRSNFANQFKSEQTDLHDWVVEILDGLYPHLTQDHLFHNYADDNNSFADCSSTALITASTYRLAVLTNTYHHIPQAEKSRQSISDGTHFDSSGWLTPVVNPFNWSISGSESPEGQAFVVEMQSAWRDWVAVGAPGVNSAMRMRGRMGGAAGLYGVFGGVVIAFVVLLL